MYDISVGAARHRGAVGRVAAAAAAAADCGNATQQAAAVKHDGIGAHCNNDGVGMAMVGVCSCGGLVALAAPASGDSGGGSIRRSRRRHGNK